MTIEPADDESAWSRLSALTHARVGLGREGSSLPTAALLKLRSDQIQAAASVHAPFDTAMVVAQLREAGIGALTADTLAVDREDYLRHPDHGRTLTDDSRAELRSQAASPPWDVTFIVSDGLSTQAAQSHAAEAIIATRQALMAQDQQIQIAPVVVVPLARVGLLNDAGAAMGARVAVILLGERPGLSGADSLSAYLEFDPRAGLTDADRNCISNIRPKGLDVKQAASNLAALITESRAQEISGVDLKVEFGTNAAIDHHWR